MTDQQRKLAALPLEALRLLANDAAAAYKVKRAAESRKAAWTLVVKDRVSYVSRSGFVCEGVVERVNNTKAHVRENGTHKLWAIDCANLTVLKSHDRPDAIADIPQF